MSKHLDDMVREFREYAEGKNGYDELDFKADILAWHREELIRSFSKVTQGGDSGTEIFVEGVSLYRYLEQLRASLEVEDE